MTPTAAALRPEAKDAICDDLAKDVALVTQEVSQRIAGLQRYQAAQRADAAPLAAMLGQQDGYVRSAHDGLVYLAARPLRVVLMGRTQAGKSTLYCALTGAPREVIGEGAQATTRRVQDRPALELPDVVVFDTPGVGAQDRPEDREAALDQARNADVVVWVCTNDSFQVEEQNALDEVLDWGSPVVLVLHCFYALSESHRVDDFLTDVEDHPVNVMARETGHLARPRRALLARGQAAVVEVPVHAPSYLLSLEAEAVERAQALRCASNMDALLSVFETEARELRHLRRVTATADHVRALVSELAAVADAAAKQAEAASVAAGRAADEASSMCPPRCRRLPPTGPWRWSIAWRRSGRGRTVITAPTTPRSGRL